MSTAMAPHTHARSTIPRPRGSAAEPSICVVIPYFGEWPFWFPFFLASCRANPTIDWLLLSDCGEPADCPPNVRVLPTTYADYCRRIATTLGIRFEPGDPYKLCDLKPALGYLHEAELAGYDFWAFGDIDLVYGDLRAYFTAQRLRGRMLLSTHARRVSGHLCVIRNTPEMRRCFMRVPRWQERLADPQHCAFDEGPFSRLFVRHKNLPPALANVLRKLNPLWRASEFVEAFTTPHGKIAWVDGSREYPRKWFWRNGTLTNDRDGTWQFPYVHFMVWKSREWARLPAEARRAFTQLAGLPEWEISGDGFRALTTPSDRP